MKSHFKIDQKDHSNSPGRRERNCNQSLTKAAQEATAHPKREHGGVRMKQQPRGPEVGL